MKVPWKIIGLAGVAGVTAATGVAVARKRRDHAEYDPDELRDRLHSRVADADDAVADTAEAEAEAPTLVDQPAPWQASGDGDTAPEAPADEPAA